MIPKSELFATARANGVRPEIVERDYVLAWLLKSVIEVQAFALRYAFKGGTALRKLYYPDYRYSQDLDFTLTAALGETELRQIIEDATQAAQQQSAIVFDLADLRTVREVPGEEAYRARIEYQGPLGRQGGTQPRITLDLTLYEKVVLPLEERRLHHPYSDAHACQASIQVYALEEMLAEKMRALLRRRYARDVYDLWFLFQYHVGELDFQATRHALEEKSRFKGYSYAGVDDFLRTAHREDLERTWTASLEYQTRTLPKYRTVERELRKWITEFLGS